MKTIDIKGKPYVMVHERIIHFKTAPEYKGWTYKTELIHLTDDSVAFRCTVYDQDGKIHSTGHAQEFRENTSITRTSYVEVCETSAVGRALGFLNIGIEEGLATAEEVRGAISAQDNSKPWLNEKTFVQAIDGMNTMSDQEDRRKAYEYLDKTYRMKTYYRKQLQEIVETVDIPGFNKP